jgi:hypothetical protein
MHGDRGDGDPADHLVWPSVLADALAWLFDQSKLVRLLPNLILVPAKEARGLRERVPEIEGVRQVGNVHFGPGLA